ncbi:MAG: hypothetical protein JNM31_15195 [Flavobacteriales bacterium]|nr:hypothetical protein [Flavobacteriales bacterium]
MFPRRSHLALFLVLALGGCRKQEYVVPEHDHVHTVDLKLNFVFMYGAHSYELASEYVDDFGQVYKLDRIRFLVSGLHVIDDDLSVLADYPTVQLLVDAGEPSVFALGSLTAAHAHQVNFTLGLNTALNHADPDTCGAPLNDPDMHWGMGPDQGFWFLVLEGRYDSDGSGEVDATDAAFSYRCGTDALKRAGWALLHVAIPDGGVFTVEVPVDIRRLMGGVDVQNNSVVHGEAPLNVQLMDSLEVLFRQAH